MTEKIKVGDWVEWTSHAQGDVRTKRGECIAVVPAGVKPRDVQKTLGPVFSCAAMDKWAYPRSHESYFIALPMAQKGRSRKVYWPHIKGLEKIERGET